MWHSFRFTAADIDQADALLLRAIALDPQFARAHAGLSFSLFSRVFLDGSKDREGDLARAVDLARTSVSLQPRDSMGHWSLGRALLLSGEHDQALASIDRALIANPNYAQGHYARGFVEAHSNLGDAAVQDLDMAHRLSPFDPMVFAMMSCRAISLAVTGRHAESADWAQRATREGNAHFHIHAIAAACLQLAGRQDDAKACVAQTLELHPGYNVAVFQRSLPHKSAADQRLIGEALRAAGMTP
jgi:tetratricopeptide (TPR) repeat protein